MGNGNGTGSLYASAKALPSVVVVGILGLTNLGVLTLISAWRTVVLLRNADAEDFRDSVWRKKLLLHVLLLLSTLTDLPMYASFCYIGSYDVVTYAFHKFECAFVFAAYSITITDWSSMLHEIHEDSRVPFLLKRGIVWTINLLVTIIALLNFIFCLAMNDLDTYTQTPIYLMGVVTQLCASLLLTCVMLQGGIKLAWRIRGASGRERQTTLQALAGASASLRGCIAAALALPWALGVALLARCRPAGPQGELGADLLQGEGGDKDPLDQSVHSGAGSNTATTATAASSSQTGLGATSDVRSSEFVSALRCLNLVMATCASCEFVQMTLLYLNWILGYADSETATVGNVYFYWTFYAWFPLWGVVLSLLYLAASRNASSLKRRQLPPPPSTDPDQERPSDSFSQPLLHDIQRGPADSERGAPSPAASMASGYSSPGSRSHSAHSFTASDVFFRALGLENHPHPSSDLSDRTASLN